MTMTTYKCPKCGNDEEFGITFKVGQIEQYLYFDLYVSFKGKFEDIFFSPVIILTSVLCHKCKYKDNPDLFSVKSYD